MIKTLEKQFKDKLVLVNIRHNCGIEFDKFTKIPIEMLANEPKLIKINKSDDYLYYDSKLELDIIKKLNEFDCVKKIKSQSLIIYYKNRKRIRKYFPDLQILLKDNSIAIVEIKTFKEMVNYSNINKYKELKKYCKSKNYYLTEIDYFDNNFYSFHDLISEVVSEEIMDEFVSFVKKNRNIEFSDCKDFKDKYNIDDKQICNIIYKKKRYLRYQEGLIKYMERRYVK